MSLTNLISEIEIHKYIMRECVENSGYGSDDIVEDIIEEIKKNLPRPEILAFADAMEAEMARHDAEKGDSWKDCPLGILRYEFSEAIEEWYSTARDHNIDPDHYLDIANFCMMLHWRAKNELTSDKG